LTGSLKWDSAPPQQKIRLLETIITFFSRPYLVRSRLCYSIASVCPSSSSVTLCIVAKRYVLEQKLLLSLYEVVYEKSIGTKMNDLDLCLEVLSRSRHHCVTFDVEYIGNR